VSIGQQRAVRPSLSVAAAAACVVIGSFQANASCALPGSWWLQNDAIEQVFSGIVVKTTRVNDQAYRAEFTVERVWKGDRAKQLDVYFLEWASAVALADAKVVLSEIYRVDVGKHYLVGAKRLTSIPARRELRLDDDSAVAYTPVECGVLLYGDVERAGVVAELGPGRLPRQRP
jgi:hypothetical protein